MNRVVLLVASLVSCLAVAQQIPIPDVSNSVGLQPQAGGPSTIGDGVRAGNLNVLYQETDFALQTSLGELRLTRSFSTVELSELGTGAIGAWPTPNTITDVQWFGLPDYYRHQFMAGQWKSSLEGTVALDWGTNMVSGIAHTHCNAVVTGPEGDALSYHEENDNFCYGVLPLSGGGRLKHTEPPNGGVDLVNVTRPSGEREAYTYVPNLPGLVDLPPSGSDRNRGYLLSSIYSNNQYATTNSTSWGTPLASLSYDSNSKVQWIDVFGGGRLEILWDNGHVSTVKLWGVGATAGTTVVEYGYDPDGRLISVYKPSSDTGTNYKYGAPGFPEFTVQQTAGGFDRTLFTKHLDGPFVLPQPPAGQAPRIYGAPTVSLDENEDGEMTFEPNYYPATATMWWSHVTKTTFAGILEETIRYNPKSGLTTEVYIGASGATVRAAASEWSNWNDVQYPQYLNSKYSESADLWRRDFVGNYTVEANAWDVYDQGTPDMADDIYSTEVRSVSNGASSNAGAGALQSSSYAYQYANTRGVHERLPASSTVASVLSPGQSAVTRYKYDLATKRLMAILRTGYTQHIKPDVAKVEQVTIGTFYFTNYECSGEADLDVYNRIVEVHGPCFVSNADSATDCDPTLNINIPVTQYRFWDRSEPTDNAGRLKSIATYPETITARDCKKTRAPVVTQFLEYDAYGHVLKELDANGVDTTRVYVGERLVQESKAGASTRYFYDASQGGSLSAKRLPDGEWEIYCYRIGSDDSCQGGTLSLNLQWTAKIAASDVSTAPAPPYIFVSRKVLIYLNGEVLGEMEGRGGDMVPTERVVRHQYDALGREIETGYGLLFAPKYFSRALFDEMGNQLGAGLPYNDAPAACGGFASPSDRCTWTDYDRLNRPARTTTPAPLSTQTDIHYDQQGNMVQVEQVPNSTNGASYLYDDFGNVVLANAASVGVSQEFDARGNLIKKQSTALYQQQRLLEYRYDSMNRPLWALSPDGSTYLWRYGYDRETATPPTNCPDPMGAGVMGRVQWKDDSFGRTWFEYDDLGNPLGARRVRAGTGGDCSVPGLTDSRDETPDTRYVYSGDGRLLSMKYPHGRGIFYEWGGVSEGRSGQVITVGLLDEEGNPWKPLLKNISYDVAGRVESYDLATEKKTSVEWLRYGVNNAEPPSTDCKKEGRPTSYDGTGRLSQLLVSRAPMSSIPEDRVGDIFKLKYGWTADQISAEVQCLLSESQGVRRTYTYDRTLQLTTAQTTQNAPAANTWQTRTYAYVNDSDRHQATEDGDAYFATYDAHNRLSEYRHTSCAGCAENSWRNREYTWDWDGRLVTESDTPTVYPLGGLAIQGSGRSIGFQPDDGYGAVYKAVSVSGGTYEYYYDASGRRRMKVYPTGVEDEYFYDGDRLLEDRGNPELKPGLGVYTIDEYVWLAGMPVAVLKSELDSEWKRRDEPHCTRNGEGEPCGTFFIVNDGLPKPVAMIDSAGLLAGAADYDPFGRVNTVSRVAQPVSQAACGAWPFGSYTAGQQQDLMSISGVARGNGYQREARINYATVNTAGINDYAQVLGPSGVLTSKMYGLQFAVDSEWFSVPLGTGAVLHWTASGTQQDSCLAPRSGVVVSGYEYRQYESGAATRWIPLRFPGQYADAETGLHENWNRFYDPSLGRYTATDPILFAGDLGAALSNATYAYVQNNPVNFADPRGLQSTGADKRSENLSRLRDDLWRACQNGDNEACNQHSALMEALGAQAVAAAAVSAAVVAGEVGAFRAAYSLLQAAVKRVWLAAVATGRWISKNISVDGPSPGLRYANGRVVGLRWRGGVWGVRLDLHPLKDSRGTPILHINYGPASLGENAPHVVLLDPRDFQDWWSLGARWR